MNQRKVWTQYEDCILRKIVTQNRVKKWSAIARIMESEFQIQGRTGKQCRQRWHNRLDPKINIQVWTEDQENKLFYYHNIYGNKWAKISSYLPGRSDNCIKNHFYSTLRKAFRGINRYILQSKKRNQMKPLKNNTLAQIISLAQQDLQDSSNDGDLFDKKNLKSKSFAIELKNKLVQYGRHLDRYEQNEQDCELILNGILEVNKSSRSIKIKKKKKFQNNSDDGDQLQINPTKIQEQMDDIKDQSLQKIPKIQFNSNQTVVAQVKKQFLSNQISNQIAQPSIFQPFNFQNIGNNLYYPYLIDENFLRGISQYLLLNPYKCHCCCDCINKRIEQSKSTTLTNLNTIQNLNEDKLQSK